MEIVHIWRLALLFGAFIGITMALYYDIWLIRLVMTVINM